MTTERHAIVASSYLVLVRENMILLSRRFNTGYMDGCYSFVAGHVEHGESFTDAVIREAKEEAGVDLDPKDLRVAHVMHRSSSVGSEERVDIFFTTEKWDGVVQNMEPDRCDEIIWARLDDLPENIVPYIRFFIDQFLSGSTYSEYGWKSLVGG